jgi:plasmid maintenance system antidote protein VapI
MSTKTAKTQSTKPATKGQQIVETYVKHPDWTRQQVADACGCTVGRVGELIRSGATNGVGAKPASTKGDAIYSYFVANGPCKREEVAAHVGCTVARVGEIIRANDELVAHGDGLWGLRKKGARKSAAKKATTAKALPARKAAEVAA